MKEKNSWLKHLDFILMDVIIYIAAFLIANLIYLHDLHYYPTWLYCSVLLCIIFPCLLIDITHSPFSGVLRRDNTTEVIIAVRYISYSFLFALALMYIFKLGSLFSRITFLLTYVCYLILVVAFRIFWKRVLISGRISYSAEKEIPLLIVSSSKEVGTVLRNLNGDEYKQYDIRGLYIVDDVLKGKEIKGYPVLCGKDDLYECIKNTGIHEVFFNAGPDVIDRSLFRKLIEEGVGIHLSISEILGVSADDQFIDSVGIYKTLGISEYSFSTGQIFYLKIKRILDIILSLIALIPLALFTVIIKISYLLSGDRDPIFFTQTRIGKDGQPFKMYKFRTMVYDAEEVLTEILKDDEKLKEWNKYHMFENDPRITMVGKMLRTTSMDELPQFINVLKGDMSIIGPRPLVEGELEMHKGLKLYEKIKPGISGWWACNGRSNITYDERLDMEYYYVKNCSFFLDVLTFFRTIFSVIRKTGAR